MFNFQKISNLYIWQNNRFMPLKEKHINVFSHSLHYSGAVFEGIRVYKGKPFKQLEHYERFKKSAELIGYHIDYSSEFLCKITEQLININSIKSGYVRPIAWRGPEDWHVSGGNCKINVAILVYNPFYDEKPNRALKLNVAQWKKIPSECVPYDSKSSGLYMMSTIMKNEALSRSFDDSIILDQNNCITEATTSNFFVIAGEEIYTPALSCFLNGITRQTVINDIAPMLNKRVHEKEMQLTDLVNANAAFLTGTASGIVRIQSIYDDNSKTQFSFNIENNLLRNLQTTYKNFVLQHDLSKTSTLQSQI